MMIVLRTLIALAMGALAATADSAAAQDRLPITLTFAAVVGDQPARCGTPYTTLGSSAATASIAELKLYLSDIRLVDDAGVEVPLRLEQDDVWQFDDVALLDFEDASGDCTNGTEVVRNTVVGHAPPGSYTGVRFALGVPFFKNHVDPTLQPSPLNLSRMFWTWNAGYKFLRVDLRTNDGRQGWMFHLGSTGCAPNEGPNSVPDECSAANRADVALDGLDPASDVIEFDLGSLFATSDVASNTPETPSGCMSAPSDPECGPLFGRLGLDARHAC